MQDNISLAKEYIRNHFPEMRDVEPTMSQPAPEITVFTFRKTFSTPDGAQLQQMARVYINDDGKVLKMVTSK
ncbi:MAG: hypothetical protein Q8P59_08440 [Dehalococcoidia bacterium]|nr:hypothetical protein [Dehalococcoidia bacterium]